MGRGVFLAVLISTSLLVKVSCLPLLATVPLFVLLGSPSPRLRRLLVSVLCFTLAPLLAILAAARLAGIEGAFLVDIRHLAGEYSFSRSHLIHFALEMALLGQFAWLLLLRRKQVAARVDPALYRSLLGVLLLFLAGTVGFKAPPIPRLYLPLVPMLGILAAPHLVSLVRPSRLPPLLAVYAGGNLALGVAGLLLSW